MNELISYVDPFSAPLVPIKSKMDDIRLKQYINIAKANTCLKSTNVCESDKVLIHTLKRECDNKGFFSTKEVQDNNLWGRLRPYRGKNGKSCELSLFKFSRGVRHLLCDGYYYDIDIKNSEPTIILAYLRRHLIRAPNLENYVYNRDTYIKQIMTDFKINDNMVVLYNKANPDSPVYTTKDLAKKLPLKIINGGSLEMFLKSIDFKQKVSEKSDCFWTALQREMNSVIESIKVLEPNVWSYALKTCQEKNKSFNQNGTFICHLYFELERRIVETAIFANTIPDNEIVYEYDGFKVPKSVLDKDPELFFSNIKRAIINTFGMEFEIVEFVKKPMDEKIVLKIINSEIKNIVENIIKFDIVEQTCATYYYDLVKDSLIYIPSLGLLYCNKDTNIWTDNYPPDIVKDNISKWLTSFTSHISSFLSDVKAQKHYIKVLGSFTCANNVYKFLLGKITKENSYIQNFESKPNLFCFSDGNCIDLAIQPLNVRKIKPDDFVIAHCGYPYKPESEIDISKARDFIYSLHENKDNTDSLLSFLSCSLYGSNNNQVFPIFTGIGANGKSILNELLRLTFGHYYQTINVNQLTSNCNDRDKPNSELSQCKYARCLTTSEPPSSNTSIPLNTATIKYWTGCEPITTRGLHKDAFRFVPHFTLFLSCNDIPDLDKLDGGISRRVKVVHFPFQFLADNLDDVEDNIKLRDSELSNKFSKSDDYKYGFLYLLLASYFSNKGKIVETQSVKENTNEYLKKNSELFCWFEQCCIVDLNASTSSEELWEHYVKTNSNSENTQNTKRILSRQTFLTKIKDVVKKERDSSGKYIYRCLLK
jgi:P4 family phage/plasmid primase-like protien